MEGKLRELRLKSKTRSLHVGSDERLPGISSQEVEEEFYNIIDEELKSITSEGT